MNAVHLRFLDFEAPKGHFRLLMTSDAHIIEATAPLFAAAPACAIASAYYAYGTARAGPE